MNNLQQVKKIIIVIFSALLGGCATLSPEEQYANATAKNISILRSQLERFSQAGDKLSSQRITSLAEFDHYVRELEKDIEIDHKSMQIVMTKCNNSGKCIKTGKFLIFDNIIQLSEGIKLLGLEAVQKNDALLESMLATQKTRTLSNEELSSVEKNLLTLGKPRSFNEEIVSLYGYGQEVNKELKEAREAAKDSEITSEVELQKIDANNIALVDEVKTTLDAEK